jgi:STE24 endopeptidase
MLTTLFFKKLFLFLIFFKTSLQIILNLLNKRHIAQKRSHVPEIFKNGISLTDHQKAADYSITKINFENITILLGLIVMLIFFPFGFLDKIDLWLSQFQFSEIQQGLLFFGAFSIISLFLSLPEKIYMTFVIEEKFGFNKTTPRLFAFDLIKGILVGILIGAPLMYGMLWFMKQSGEHWWVWVTCFIFIFQIIILWAYPKFIAPIFNKFSPLDNPELELKLNDLLTKTQITFKEFYIMNASLRSSHGNAYFTGFGKNKRIVFFDTLLKSLTSNQVIAVLAHELGHLKHKHILKRIIKSFFLTIIGFYILSILYPMDSFYHGHFISQKSSYMALFLFSTISGLYTFIFTPLFTWLSRKNEFEADAFALKFTNGKDKSVQ